MSVTDYAYDSKFEKIAIGMGLKYGMFAFNDNGYINPIVKTLYNHYKINNLTQKLVDEKLALLK
jgi:hypothetical protein